MSPKKKRYIFQNTNNMEVHGCKLERPNLEVKQSKYNTPSNKKDNKLREILPLRL